MVILAYVALFLVFRPGGRRQWVACESHGRQCDVATRGLAGMRLKPAGVRVVIPDGSVVSVCLFHGDLEWGGPMGRYWERDGVHDSGFLLLECFFFFPLLFCYVLFYFC